MPTRFISPGSLLASFSILPTQPGRLIIVTGESGAGKTTWCLNLVSQAHRAGMKPVGLVSLPVVVEGVKTGIDLLDLSSGAQRRLARRRDTQLLDEAEKTVTQDWCFDIAVLEWGNQILQTIQHCQILVIDELGPLEFLERQGFTASFDLIGKRDYQLACVVIRPVLLPTARRLWPWHETVILHGTK